MSDIHEDGRLKSEPGAARRPRGAEDRRVTQDREYTEDERLKLFRLQQFHDALPSLPDIPGYHLLWHTTTNTKDTVAHRMRLGYELVKPEDVPGYEEVALKTGEYAGAVGINEMIALKLPLDLYQLYMREAHHAEPRRQEEIITVEADRIAAEARGQGADIIEDDGLADIRRSRPAPNFS